MFAGIPRFEQGTIVLETIMIPISPYTYTCTIHHIRTVPMSPQLCYFALMSGAVGEDTRGKGWSRTTILGFSVRCIDQLCYLPISAESRGLDPHTFHRTHNLADWFLAFRIYSPLRKNRVRIDDHEDLELHGELRTGETAAGYADCITT